MAILARKPVTVDYVEIPNLMDPQRRIIATSYNNIHILNLYVPNGESLESEKYQYKLNWLEKMAAFVKEQLKQHNAMIILGDFNIAPEDRDVYDPVTWQNRVLVSEPEREALKKIINHGFIDTFRLFELSADDTPYSWWNYRAAAFRRNMGLRIDLILASEALSCRCQRCYIDKKPRGWERPSDHAPVVAIFD